MFEIIQDIITSIGIALIGIVINTLSVFGIYKTPDKEIVIHAEPSTIENVEIQKDSTTTEQRTTDIEIKNSNPTKEITTQEKKISKKTNITPSTETSLDEQSIPKEIPTTTLIEATLVDSAKLNADVRNALVNIICTTKSSGSFNPASGSGIIIDPRGIVLTNAHVAQYFLLENYNVENYMDCLLRTGAPAYPTYDAEILYISPAWIKENKGNIILNNPTGTGENDFALLRITKSIQQGKELPENFPFVAIDTDENNLIKNTPVFIAGYPAGFLGGTAIQKNLWPVTTFSEIIELLTFKTGSLDAVSLLGNIAAQKGSSGGGAINMTNGKLTGIIVTSTEAEQTGDRILNALTIQHINRSIFAEIGINLDSYLTGDLKARADNFNQTISPSLTTLLETVLEN